MTRATAPAAERIAPSIMCCDLLNVSATLDRLDQAGIRWLHVDVMDGRFAPNFTFGRDFVFQLRKAWPHAIGLHIMSHRQEQHLDLFLDLRLDLITVHVEQEVSLTACISRIKDAGIMAGLAFTPDTPLDARCDRLATIDAVLVMGVSPGSVGQRMDRRCLGKIGEARGLLDGLGNTDATIIVDGGVSIGNAPELIAAGADRLVSGSALFHADHLGTALQEMMRSNAN